jgi:putative Mg2+ transporter-C (MgtC) family protein
LVAAETKTNFATNGIRYKMPIILTWQAITLRLLLTAVCAGLLGFNRDERGHSAGLRTNLLVGLAASIAMIQANWLINSNGKPADSFVVMDVMRLPLGILSGIGFIGAGAILKRGEMATGVTTAATIWFVTVMGLCFGGGQIGLGLAGFALGLLILTLVRRLETWIPRRHIGQLTVSVAPDGPTQNEIGEWLSRGGMRIGEATVFVERSPGLNRVYGWKVDWKGRHEESSLPTVVEELSAQPAIQKLELKR